MARFSRLTPKRQFASLGRGDHRRSTIAELVDTGNQLRSMRDGRRASVCIRVAERTRVELARDDFACSERESTELRSSA